MALQAASLYGTVSIAGAENSVGLLRRVDSAVDTTQGRLNRLAGGGAQAAKGVHQIAGGILRLSALAAGAAITAVGASAKIAASFEDAFATVEKTVEGTPAQLKLIDDQLRKLSTTIPVGYTGLTTIASEAGALGVKAGDIDKFTEAVARTSAATVGLDPFQASEAFGKLSTIFGLTGDKLDTTTGKMVSDYERLGSSLVALGNAGASSEADIIAVTKRFAAAGQVAGLSAAEVLGWSSALASLGPEAEAAGGALQRIFNRAARNIGLMGEPGLVGKNAKKRVQTFAAVTGMTVDEFAKAYAADASGAMQKFFQGLAGMDQFKQAKVLFDAGIINQRDILAVQAFTQRFGILNQQLQISNDAWKKGTALQDVSEKRFDTLKSKAIEFKNQILLAAVALGEGGVNASLGRLMDKAKLFVQGHMKDISRLGAEIGQGIDSIDWAKVEGGVERIVGLARDFLDILRKVPAEITLSVGAFLGLNKLSGGLLGAGAINVVGGVGKMIGNALLNGVGKLPIIGGTVGALTAMRVFVTNWPAGGFGPGGGPPINPTTVATATAAAGLPTAATVASAIAAISIAMIPVAAAGLALSLSTHEQRLKWDLQSAQDTVGARGGDPSAVPANVFHGGRTAAPRTPGYVSGVLPHDFRSSVALAPDDRGLLQQIAANTSGSPDDRDEKHRKALDANIEGKVKHLAHLGAIGSKDDPYGFKHIKTFALGQLGKNDPLGLKGELMWHIGEVDKAIVKAQEKGDTKTVTKLSETRAALVFMLDEVKNGTFKAGERAYQGALAVVAQVAALQPLLRAIRGIPIGGPKSSYMYTGIPTPPPGSTSLPSLTGSGARHAMGITGIVKSPYQAVIGEAGNEEAAIIRNPRQWAGGGGGEVIEIRPQRVSVAISGREIAQALVPWTVSGKRRNA